MTPTEKVQQDVQEYLTLPASFPLVCDATKNMLVRRSIAHDRRRKYLAEPEPITGFDQLQQEQKQ